MAVNTVPIYTKGPIVATAQVSAANTNRDGTGTLVTVVTGGTDGYRIDSIRVTATVTTTAGMVRFYMDNLTNVRLFLEIPVNAITVGANIAGFNRLVRNADGSPLFVLPNGYILKASTHNAEAINIMVCGGSYTA